MNKTILATLLVMISPAAALAERLPNIVLLIGDDHGYPYCRPSLRTMLTGFYPVQYQLRLNEHIERRKQEDRAYAKLSDKEKRMWMSVEKADGMKIFDTLPKLLKQKGYVSWQGGKWWENSYRSGYFDEGMTEGWEQDADDEYWRPGVSYYTDSLWATGGLGGKGSLYDLSFRTPMIFYWKDHMEASFNESSLVSSIDLVPTILDLVGVKAPAELLGYSLLPLLKGAGNIEERTEMIGYSNNRRSDDDPMGSPAEGYSVRTHRWHFFWYADTGEMLLYDVTSDPRGEIDLSQDRPELVAEFKMKIAHWKTTVGMRERIDIHE